MTEQLIYALQSAIGLIVGGMIGAGFGIVQNTARERNEKRQASGDLSSGWAVMPGSGKRIAALLIALVLVQLGCPLLFRDGVQWWVSVGVASGYGVMLFRQLRQRMSQGR